MFDLGSAFSVLQLEFPGDCFEVTSSVLPNLAEAFGTFDVRICFTSFRRCSIFFFFFFLDIISKSVVKQVPLERTKTSWIRE